MSTPFEHALSLMHADAKDSVLRMCLMQNSYKDLTDLRLLDQNNIESLTVTIIAGEVKQLNQVHRRKLTTLMEWFDLKGANYEVELLKATTFDTLINAVNGAKAKVQAAKAALAASAPAPVHTYTTDLAANFAKGIKLDDSKLPKLENKTNFLIWKRDTKTAAKMLGVWNVLDDTYTANTADEIALYELQQSWMYAAFGKTLCTLNSKRIWKKYPDNARSTYLELRKENETVLKMKFYRKELEDAYKTFKWTQKFNGPLASFLEKWTDKARDYDAVKKVPKLTDTEL